MRLSCSAAPPVSSMVGRPDGRLTTPMSRQNTPCRKPGAERLGAGLLGGEALGVGRGARSRGRRICARSIVGEDAVEKAVAEALERRLDAADVDDVVADARGSCLTVMRSGLIGARALQRAPRPSAPASASPPRARPPKIASPIRKWPMLSSTTSGMRATGADRVEGQAVAGVDLEARGSGERAPQLRAARSRARRRRHRRRARARNRRRCAARRCRRRALPTPRSRADRAR